MGEEVKEKSNHKIIRDLAALGIEEALLDHAFQTLDIEDTQRLMRQFHERINDPFVESELLMALLEQAESQTAFDTFAYVAHLLTYHPLDLPHMLVRLNRCDPIRALPILRSQCALTGHGADLIIESEYGSDLEHALNDSLVEVALKAVDLLERRSDSRALISALTTRHPKVRASAAWFLGRVHIREAAPALIAALKGESDLEVTRAILWSLGVLGDPLAIDSVRAYLDHESEVIVQTARETLNLFSRSDPNRDRADGRSDGESLT